MNRLSARFTSLLHSVMTRDRNLIETLGFASLTIAALVTVFPIVLVVGFVFWNGAEAISLEFITQMPRDGMRAGGILPAIVGTILLTIGTGIIAVPLGIGAALSRPRITPVSIPGRA